MKTKEKELRFAFWGHQGWAPVARPILHIRVNGSFKPVLIRLITGKKEILSGLAIIKKLDIGVCFGSDRPRVGQGDVE